MHTLAFFNTKGGVGKTTSCVNLAYLSGQERPTLLWDLDSQGAASFYLGDGVSTDNPAGRLFKTGKDLGARIQATGYGDLDLLPSDFRLRHLDVLLGDSTKAFVKLVKTVRELRGRYQALFFDCPPSLSLLSEFVFETASHLVMPVIPSPLSMQSFLQVRDYYLNEGKQPTAIIPFFSQVDARKSLHRDLVVQGQEQLGFCKTVVPARSVIEQMGTRQAPLPHFDTRSDAQAAYRALWEEIKQKAAVSVSD